LASLICGAVDAPEPVNPDSTVPDSISLSREAGRGGCRSRLRWGRTLL
jgi:hypothetical protein